MVALAVIVLVLGVGVAWDWEQSGLQGTGVTRLEQDDVGRTGIYASTLGSGIHLSQDRGHTWWPWNEGLGADSVRGIASVAPFGDGRCPYSLFYAATPSGVWCRWTEDASIADSVWQPANRGLSELDITAVATDGSWEAVCGTQSGELYRRSFEDTCWQSIGSPLSRSGPISSISLGYVSVSGQFGWGIYVVGGGAQDQGLFRSMDWGQSWELLAVGESVGVVQHVWESHVVAGCSGGALGRSTDAGETWVVCYVFPPSSTCTSYLAAVGSHAWAGADSGGVAHTINGWRTWSSWGGEFLRVRSLQATEADLLAGTDTGVYRIRAAPAEDPPVPGNPALTLWPNPSQSGPKVELRLVDQGTVIVAVHDLLGRRLRALDHSSPAAGLCTLPLAGGGGLTPGTYVCTVEISGRTLSRRFVVIGP